MKRFARTLGVTLGIVIVGSAQLLVPQTNATGALPPVTCRPVHGTFHSVFTSCTRSPVGLCTAGTISDAGILDGTTTFLAFNVAPSAGMPSNEPKENLSYSGQLTITASNGTLVTTDLGVLDERHFAFTEIERPASGTGVFANPGTGVFANPETGVFFISGSIVENGTGFQGDLSGTVLRQWKLNST